MSYRKGEEGREKKGAEDVSPLLPAITSRRGMQDLTGSLLSQQNVRHCDIMEGVGVVGCGGNWYAVHCLLKPKCNCFHPVNAESRSLIPTQLILLFSHAFSELLYLIRCHSIYLSVKSGVNSQIQGQMKTGLKFLSAKLANRKVEKFH